jgi:hypothetical protein
MRPATYSHVHKEQPWLSMARQGPEGHAVAKVSCNVANCSIALVGKLLDSIAVKKEYNLRGSAAAPMTTCRRNSRRSRAR